ncbi:SLAM family member 5-like isoform X2 [Dromiciops gliroides]|uniref:SLAM family member 5-like isoform X2 n=1 Tax=Dromiciops gliroides TaxID=33562 RepID=UPI001CC7C826|nr:SLAM family member 5-like isoform X2 [Dromiciops gliroides]
MTQPHLWFLVVFLFVGSRASREKNDSIMVTGILGESAILPIEIPTGKKLDNINWFSHTSVALVQPEATSVKIITTHQNYRGRLNVPNNTYNLEISPLKMEDAGNYKADINLQDLKTATTSTNTKNYILHVYRRLAPPTISQSAIASENKTCNITLTCLVEEGGDDVKYQWTPLGEQAVESSGRSMLFIFQRPGDVPINYTCTVTNPVSNNSESILIQHPCEGRSKSSHLLWFILLPFLVMIALGIWLQHKRKKDADSSSTSQVPTKDPFPHVDNRVYDEIMPKATVPNPQKEESPNTIYYTVQKPTKVENPNSSSTKLLGTSTNEFVI